jgi:hypothetical protein
MYTDGDLCISAENARGKTVTNGSGHDTTTGDMTCLNVACERARGASHPGLIVTIPPPTIGGLPVYGGGDFEQYIPDIIEMAQKAAIDPQLLLANYMIESASCDGLAAVCAPLQEVQAHATDDWWDLLEAWYVPLLGHRMGQGDHASIGTANMDRTTYEQTQDNTANGPRPELAGHSWFDLIGNPKLSIAAMAHRLEDLQSGLQFNLDTTYSRNELIRLGYRSTWSSMMEVATGSPMNPGSVANTQMFDVQYARAGRWLSYYNQGQL